MWAGFRIGSGQAHPPAMLLQMPSGILMGGLCVAAGLFLSMCAAKEFAEEDKNWWKRMLATLALLVLGGAVFNLHKAVAIAPFFFSAVCQVSHYLGKLAGNL
ncbi:MAG: hypothetical protein LBU79_06495 [Planctomycetota bacterium]|jgi:hypothetical protein|nr:hypothetical protein [Planctomycetota bacterium]